ncbi:MAG: hypothetical protein HOW73_28595 [Polyangiaceae bacterium]|nr:hypothetical protein [Polyangiaceae bacterium]
MHRIRAGHWFCPLDIAYERFYIESLIGEHRRRLARNHDLPDMRVEWITSFRALPGWARDEQRSSAYAAARSGEEARLIRSAPTDRLAGAHAAALLATFEVIRTVGAEVFRAAVANALSGPIFWPSTRQSVGVTALASTALQHLMPIADEVPRLAVSAFFAARRPGDLLDSALQTLWITLGARLSERIADAGREAANACRLVFVHSFRSWLILMKYGLIGAATLHAGTLPLVPADDLGAFEPLADIAQLGAVPLGAATPHGVAVFTRTLS